ncbi:MAG: hypothetical protein AAGA75_21505, partial [Cyanobacteria bacterium P01_E01_bin.6]
IDRTIELHGEVTVNAIAAVLRHEYVTPAYDATRKSIRSLAKKVQRRSSQSLLWASAPPS